MTGTEPVESPVIRPGARIPPPTRGPATRPGSLPGGRPARLRMARIHLRTGALALARAELEAAAGIGELDDDALVDIAEARWRTGDLQGAGEAAAAHIATGGDDLLALVIAAEAAAASRGGAEDAEALVTRVMRRATLPIDGVVAGMPLGAPWPPGMDRASPDPEPRRDLGSLVEPAASAPIAPLVPIGAGRAVAGAVGGPVAATPEAAAAADPRAAFAAGSDALAAGDRETAALHLAVAMRLSPALAPAILSTVGGTPGPAYDLLRGDAFRIVGHQSDALRCYAAAAMALAERPAAAPDASAATGPVAAGAPEAPRCRGRRGSHAFPGRRGGCRGRPDPRTRPIHGGTIVTERTLVLVKPDGVQRQLVGRILGRFEERGLKIVGLKLVAVDRELAEAHYAVHRERPFFGGLVDFITSSPLVAVALEGPNAIVMVRSMVGATRPHEAAPGSIRGDLAMETAQNLVHASDGPETAVSELALWFAPGEIVDYTRDVDRWVLSPAD